GGQRGAAQVGALAGVARARDGVGEGGETGRVGGGEVQVQVHAVTSLGAPPSVMNPFIAATRTRPRTALRRASGSRPGSRAWARASSSATLPQVGMAATRGARVGSMRAGVAARRWLISGVSVTRS